MKRIIYIIIGTIFTTVSAYAQSSAVQKVAKSVFTLTTYDAADHILATSHGVFCSEDGYAISSFQPFVGASRAVVLDASGQKMEVDAIVGANDMYDICKFRVKGKTTPATFAPQAASDHCWLVGYSTKKSQINQLSIKTVETFAQQYNYYVFNEEVQFEHEGCPISNDKGEVIGLAQQAKTSYAMHSTDANYYNTLVTDGMTFKSALMQKTQMRVALPQDHEQAKVMLMMITSADDSLKAVQTINEYCTRYTTDTDGYIAKAKHLYGFGHIESAEKALTEAQSAVEDKAELLSSHAQMVYSHAIYDNDSTSQLWTLDYANSLISQAIELHPNATYSHQQGQILFAQQKWQEALDIFAALTENGELNTSEVYFEQAQCREQLGATPEELLPLLDKAIDAAPTPLTHISAPYLLVRAQLQMRSGNARLALADYNRYDTLMYMNATAEFYYLRYQCELQLRQYQQAINDIAHAAVLNREEPTYLAELAALQLRVGHFDEALKTCEICLSIAENYADVYIVQGLAYIQLQRKEEGLKAFEKAKELGDERGEEYIKKYQ